MGEKKRHSEVDQGGEQRKKGSFSFRQCYLDARREINKINVYSVFGRDTQNDKTRRAGRVLCFTLKQPPLRAAVVLLTS